jgi:hypothetical protein
MSIHFTKLPLSAILFTHFDEATGAQTDLCVSCIADHPVTRIAEPVLIPVKPEHAELCLKHRGIEEHRLKRLMSAKASKSDPIFRHADFEPILMAEWPDGSWLNIDGSHRYVAAYKLGYEWILAKLVHQEIWRLFIVEGLPKEEPDKLINSFSGIK